MRSLYVYDNTDTVFIYNENFGKFTPLYVFNAAEGDTVCLPVAPDLKGYSVLQNNPISGDTSFCFVVDSIRNRMYDTTVLKTFYTHFITEYGTAFSNDVPVYSWSNYDAESAEKGVYAERIGGVKAGLLPVKVGTWVEKPTEAVVQNLVMGFRCYSDSVYHIKMISGECDSLPPTPTGIAERAAEYGIRIYPNPSKGRFTISAQKMPATDIRLHLTDPGGRVLQRAFVEQR